MNLRNTTSNQDRIIQSELRNLQLLDINTSVLESILEDLDNSLSTALSDLKDAQQFEADRIRELETRVSELENDLSVANEWVDELERQRSALEEELQHARDALPEHT